MNNNLKGALLMMLSMLAFLINDVFMKLLSPDLPLFQAIFVRGVFTSFILLALVLINFRNLFRDFQGNNVLISLRTLGEIGGTYCFLTALFKMPIANLMMILQTVPIALTLVSVFIFKETVKKHILVALVVGFLGVLIILRPGMEGFDSYSILGLGAVAFVVLRDLSTRKIKGNIRNIDVAFLGAFSITLISGIVMLNIGWSPLSIKAILYLFASTLALVVAYQLSIAVMRVGEISFVSQFRYSAILWALIFGYFVFGEFPDFTTMTGGAIIILAGLMILWTNKNEKRFNAKNNNRN
ncbi:MAG: DMT family transporter [Paracoccaceae bacterium]